MIDELRRAATALQPELVALRRDLHRIPELGLHLPKTQKVLLDQLDGLGLEITTGTALSSIVAVLRGAQPGPTVLLRADMDALPITEDTGLPFASEHPGNMHACGHDLHMAMLIGAVKILVAQRDKLHGNVVFMFQPGEEGHDGAQYMIDEGVIEAAGDTPVRAYGIHVKTSTYPAGVFATRTGTFMASADEYAVEVIGRGGRGSAPHMTSDPVPAMAEMILALQSMVTRRFSIFDPVVVSTCVVSAGSKANIIPGTARFESTLRSFSPEARARLKNLVPELLEKIAEAHGLGVTIEFRPGYPVTVNAEAATDEVVDVARTVFGQERFHRMDDPSAGTEDFSRILERVPGCYMYLGATPADAVEPHPDNHSAQAVFDDAVLADGALMHSVLATNILVPEGAST